MQFYFTIFLLYLYFNAARGCVIRNYLADRRRFVSAEFARFQRNADERDEGKMLDFGDSRVVTLQDKSEAHTFSLFARNYLLSENELYYIVAEGNKYVLDSLRQFPEMSQKKIAFIKSMNYHGIGYMFVCFEDDSDSHVYRFINNRLEPREPIQRIKKLNALTDASFFVNDGRLHLIVTSAMGVAMAPIVVYKWMESHFDDVEKAYVNGAISVSHFTYGDVEIIVILRDNALESSNSYVYEYRGQRLNKIQILDDIQSTHILNFNRGGDDYLIVFNDDEVSTLYRWMEDEFIVQHQFAAEPHVQQVFLAHYEDDVPLIAAATKDSIRVFTTISETIQHINSREFRNRYTKIIDMQIADYNGEKVIFILATSAKNDLKFVIIPMTLNKLELVRSTRQGDEVVNCMDELEDMLEGAEDVVFGSPSKMSEKIIAEAPLEAASQTQSLLRQSEIEEILLEDLEDDYNRIARELEDLENTSAEVRSQLEGLLQDNVVTLGGKLLVQGALLAENLQAQRIRTPKLNSVPWNPSNWLSITSDQVITTPMHIAHLKVGHVNAPNTDLFQDMVVAGGNQTLVGVTTAGRLQAFNIFAPQINDVPMRSVYVRNSPSRITGNKSFNNVNVDDLHTITLNDRNTTETVKLFADPQTHKYEFQPVVQVRNLDVETINGVSWREFSESVFRIGRNQTLVGDLTLARLKAEFLQAQLVGGVNVSELLTTSTPQTVSSHVHFLRATADNLDAVTINNLVFPEDVATFNEGQTTLISGPVSMEDLEITGDLEVNSTTEEFFKQHHIVDAENRDSLQIYSKVTIHGDLHVRDLHVEDATRLFIGGNEFNRAYFDNYWLKTTNQEIPVHFEARNGISTPHLNARLLNDIPIDEYMVNNALTSSTSTTTYEFENVTIVGNVRVDAGRRHQPDVRRLNSEAVKLNGTFVLHGAKRFDGQLAVEDLKADDVNGVQINQLATKSTGSLIGAKSIRNLTVQSADVRNLLMTRINGISMEELEKRTVFVDQPAHLGNVDFSNVTVFNLRTKTINNKTFNDYVDELDQIGKLTFLNRLEIRGNATMNQIRNVQMINDINMLEIISKMDKRNNFIPSDLYFEGKVHVKELLVGRINDVDFSDLLDRLYYRVWPQNITARHTFNILNAPNVFTPQINNVRTKHLIDVSKSKPQLLKLEHPVHLTNANLERSLFANLTTCDINAAVTTIHNAPKRSWQSLRVRNLAIVPKDNQLMQIVNNAVHSLSDNNIILAPVSFNHIYAESATSGKLMNGVDVRQIANDALMFNATGQSVAGVKEFAKLNVAAIGVEGSTRIPIVNEIDVALVDRTIVPRNGANVRIEGKKIFFKGVQVGRLIAPEVMGVRPENLVSLGDLKMVPKAIFDDLTIMEDLKIGQVNNIEFDEFLRGRLLVNSGHDQISTANYFMENLHLNGKTTISSINDINLEDVVFDDGQQEILAAKKFMQLVEVFGDVTIDILNGFSISQIYEQAILLQKSANIIGNITLEAPSQITGDIQTKSINGIPMEHINELLHSGNHQVNTELIHNAIKDIEQLMVQNVHAVKRLPYQYLYLEKSDELQIPLEHTTGAHVDQKKDSVLLHVQKSYEGGACGLPARCSCPDQETVKIQPGLSWNIIENKYKQRIFSYEAAGIVVDVITNTISKSSSCRSNTGNEYTSVNWYSFPGGNSTGASYSFPEHITGYISDVQFFTLDGHTYVLLAKMYDASHNTSVANTMILRIAKDMSQVEQVQKIRTNGAAKLHVFHTAQAVNLVIGNIGDENRNDNVLTTDIYAFDRYTKLFELLRTVPSTGCISATSVVLGLDSLIILTQRNNPLQVLKYNQFYKTYYLHESFLHGTPVSSVSVFYTGGFGVSDAYLTAVSERGNFYVYSYHYLIGWKLVSDGEIEGLTALIPFEISKKQYLFAPSSISASTVLAIVKQGV